MNVSIRKSFSKNRVKADVPNGAFKEGKVRYGPCCLFLGTQDRIAKNGDTNMIRLHNIGHVPPVYGDGNTAFYFPRKVLGDCAPSRKVLRLRCPMFAEPARQRKMKPGLATWP